VKRIFITSINIFFLLSLANAQTISYSASTIPEMQKKNADVVKRYENSTFTVYDPEKAVLKVHEVLTVLNEEGSHELIFKQFTSKLISLEDADITVYDAAGKKVNHYKKKQMQTVATGDGLIEDGYVTYFPVPEIGYPMTVEYEYELRFKGTLFYPIYRVITPGQSTEYSSFTVKTPKELGLRYKPQNIQLDPVITQDAKTVTYQWTAKNVEAIKEEEGSGSFESRYPIVQLAPNRFYIYGTEGDMSTWKNFGQWINNLYTGTDELPEARKSFFRDIVKSAQTEKEKIKLLYDYLQKNFRYVSIQLGIGGYKPFTAEFTDTKKYGDCKALTNFMRAALKAVDIKSYVAIINAGYNETPADLRFPANDFNHVILCVPQQKDTIWLECTSKTADFAVLGGFTENRNALVVTEEGGVLVPTPQSRYSDNIFSSKSKVAFGEGGRGKISSSFYTKGLYKEQLLALLDEKLDKQKEFIVYALGYKTPDEFAFQKNESSDLTASLVMDVEKISEFSAGNKLFLRPRTFKLWSTKLPKQADRKSDFYFRFPFEQTDTTAYELGETFAIEALPEKKQINTPFATYTTNYVFNENEKTLYAISTLALKQRRIANSDYQALNNLIDEILMDDAQRVVIKRK
jgi:transglutaminase-like putative cysteine protease